MTSSRKHIVRWQSAWVIQNNSGHSKVILMTEYFRRFSHTDWSMLNEIQWPQSSVHMAWNNVLRTNYYHWGVTCYYWGWFSVNISSIMRSSQKGKKKKKINPEYCILFSLIWDGMKFRKKGGGRSKLTAVLSRI